MRKKLQFSSIRARLVFWFCAVSVLSFFVFSIIIYVQRVDAIKHGEFDKLQAVRSLKVREINTWLDKIIGDMKTISSMNNIRNTAYMLSIGMMPQQDAINSMKETFSRYLNNYNIYYEFFIVSAYSGKIVFSTNTQNVGEYRSKNLYLTEALRTNDIYIKDIYFSKNLNIPTMTFSLPIYPSLRYNTQAAGVLVGRIYLDRSIYDLLSDRTGMGETGETLITNKRLIALNKPRGYDGAPLTLKINKSPALMALEGKAGVVEYVDYRGKEVLAAYTYIPRTNWVFIAKQDMEELYVPIKSMLGNLVILFFVLIVIVSIIAIVLSRNVSGPIFSMIDISKRIRNGEFNVRNEINRDDELSYLAHAFNQMADSIVSQLEIQKSNSDMIEVMVSNIELYDFSSNVLKKLLEITSSNVGAFYILSDDGSEFKHFTSIGLDADAFETFHAEKLEGEFGKALATRKITRTKNISGKSIVRLRTIIGDAVPTEIINIPVIVRNRCVAIISIASLSEYSDEILEILNHIRLVMNTAFSNILAIEETRRLAEELNDKNILLEDQKEELQYKAVELKRQTERVQVQNIKLEEQRRSVEEANRLKTEFLSNMSHELRTPLNSILSLSRVLLMQTAGKISDEELSYIGIVERNGENLLALINDILDLSKIEAGRIDLNPKSISLAYILGMIVENLEQLAEEKGIGIELNIPEGLQPIKTDEARAYQIFQNIIGNAVKFTDKGGVTVSAYADDHNVYVEVEDTGSGIAERDLPHIFEEFRQVNGTLARRHEGTGLGLAIASKSANLISGSISVRSEPGKGSNFSVELPINWKISPERGVDE